MGGGGTDTTQTGRRFPRARPNWWMILAVSLALIALLVATGSAPRPARPGRPITETAAGDAVRTNDRGHASAGGTATRRLTFAPATSPTSPTSTTSTTSTTVAASSQSSQHTSPVVPVPSALGAGTTTPPVDSNAETPTTTTTTTAPVNEEEAADRSQWQGLLQPPGTTAQRFAFTGTGATEVSVVWSGTTYLMMVVSCPDASQSVGGVSAMAATLPDATGACLATVTEPASESVALTFTITIGPPGA